MSKSESVEARLSRLRGSLQKLGKELESAGETIKTEVGAGVGQAMAWTEFTHAVAPLVETAPGHIMSGREIAAALDDPTQNAPRVIEVRRRRGAFVESHGVDTWEACLRDCGRLRIDRHGGRTTVTRLTP